MVDQTASEGKGGTRIVRTSGPDVYDNVRARRARGLEHIRLASVPKRMIETPEFFVACRSVGLKIRWARHNTQNE